MKVFLRIVVLLMVNGTVRAQYVPNSGQAFQFASLYNPAFTGIESYGDLKIGYRYQWAGYKDNAPKFINLSYNVRLKQPLDLTLNALRTSKESMRNNIPRGKRIIHGLGINAFNEKVGLISRAGGGLNYSLHYPLSKKVRLATGFAALLENRKVDIDEIYLGNSPDPDPFYDNLMQGSSNYTELNIRAGMLLYSDRFYFGFSYFPVWNTVIKTSDVNFNDPFYRGSLQTGLSFAMSPNVQLRPSIMALLQMDDALLIDYSVKAYLYKKVWVGATYRDIQSGIMAAGMAINETLTASYSYEFSMGKMKGFSGGSHEVILAVRLNNFKGSNQHTW